MAGLTNYLEDKIMNHVFGSTTFTKPTNYYVGLLTATPSDSAAGTEVTGSAYARQVCAFTISGSGTAQAVNTSAITFPTADGGAESAKVRFFHHYNKNDK